MFNPYIIILGLFVITGIGTTFWGWRIIARGRRSLHWPQTDGTIDTAVPKYDTNDQLPNIVFSYTVAGQDLKQAVTFPDDTMPSPELTASYLRKYPQGAQVRVFYNPQDPRQATLEPGPAQGDWVMFVFGLLISVFGLIFLIFG